MDQISRVSVVTSQDDVKCSRDQQRQNETSTSSLGHCSLLSYLVPWVGVPLVWNSDFSFVDSEIVRDQLYQLNVYNSMEPDGICPRVLREVANVMAGASL